MTALSLGLLAAGTALTAGCGSKANDRPVVEGPTPVVGDAFPYTNFLSHDGGVVDLSTVWPQQRVMLVFMRGFDGIVCPYCTQQTANLIARYDDLKAAGLEVYVVYPGAEADVPKFLKAVSKKRRLEETTEFPMPLLLDVDLRAVRTLGITEALAKPSTFVIETDGTVIYSYVGEHMRDRPEIDTVLDAIGARTTAGDEGNG